MEENDEEIILAYRGGEEEAFKKLIDKYSAPLFNFTARLAGKENATDLVQETFIKVWKNISRFNVTKASFKTWLFTIAKNCAIDFLRKKKIFVFSDFLKEDGSSILEEIPDENFLPDERLQQLFEKENLEEALGKLSINYKAVLTLYYQEEMTFKEIAIVLGKPLNTIRSYHYRAILELKKILEQCIKNEDFSV